MFSKLVVITFITGVFTLAGCDKNETLNDDETGFTGGLWLKMGDNTIVCTSDIDFYDISTHMIYLKKKISYLEEVGYDSGILSVNVNKDEIYQCSIHSSLSSFLPQGVFIWGPPFVKEDIIRFSFMQFLNEKFEPTVKDPRNDERIIAALKKYKQYHEGLHCELQSCDYSNGKLVLNIVLYNPDTFNYYYLDINKMGLGLFHYYTNGPTFWDIQYTKSYSHQETVIQPNPWDSWKKEWLSLIKSGERKKISITYTKFDKMPAGKYKMSFAFPGLDIVKSQKELVLKDGRIQMGGIEIQKDITIK